MCILEGTRQIGTLCLVLTDCRVPSYVAHGKATHLPCVGLLSCVFWPNTRQNLGLSCASRLPCVVSAGTWQKDGLPCACVCAHGKSFSTRQTRVSP